MAAMRVVADYVTVSSVFSDVYVSMFYNVGWVRFIINHLWLGYASFTINKDNEKRKQNGQNKESSLILLQPRAHPFSL